MRDLPTWPLSRAAEAVEALSHAAGLAPRHAELPVPPEGADPGRWIESVAGWIGVEAEAVDAPYGEAEALVCGSAPAILRVESGYLALLRGGRRHVIALDPDLSEVRLPAEAVRDAVCGSVETPYAATVDRMLEEAGVAAERRPAARAAILRERLAALRIGGCWILRLAAHAEVRRHVRHARLPRRLLAFAAAHATQYALWLLSWWMIGRGALQGRIDPGWLLAWALLLLTTVPFRLIATWTQGLVAIGAGGLIKRRLLQGALRLAPDEIRHLGAGQLLGRVIESEAVESLALGGGFASLIAWVEIVAAGAVLSMGAGAAWHVTALVAWAAITCVLGWTYYRRRQNWTRVRLDMTNDLVERMVGHRTRLAQEARSRWHDGEDQALDRYQALSKSLDRITVALTAIVPRGWLVLGLAGIAPAFVSGAPAPALAVALGGILLAYRGFARLTSGLAQLSGAAIAGAQVAPFFRAAAKEEVAGSPVFALARGGGDGAALLDAKDLVYRYRDRAEPVLRGAGVQIGEGDRLLLEGPSGAGKSTLAAVLAGLRDAESGLLLLRGLDRRTLGDETWHRRVVAAPQFHENHVLTETFAFNLLMGRRWPPEPGDMEEAEELCRELGLGEVLARMPSGILQMVGETGWQLSHGERSRLYIARAILQGAEVVLLDESFAALDPENLARALRCVLGRAKTVLVVAHP